jgi:cyclase
MQFASFLTRRGFLSSASCFGAALALARRVPLPALAQSVARDSRVAEKPLLDKGFASVRQVGRGVYATVSDISKGFQTVSNGGFLVGSDAALVVEGHSSPAGAALELEALRLVSQTQVRAAVDTHCHFDHSLGNALYGSQNIPVWAHAKAAPMKVENYAPLQGQDHATLLEPLKKRVRDAANDTDRQRAEGDLNAYSLILDTVGSTVVSLLNHPLDPARLPATIDLGGLRAVIETYPGHKPTDIIVRVPEQNIVFTGDLLFNGWYPVTFDADMSAWRKTLAKFSSFDKETLFVPGHGQVCGQEGIAGLRAVMDDLAAHAKRMFQIGVPVEEALERYVVPDRFKGFLIFSWSFCVGSAIARFYQELRAKPS